jgi:hypothetical protein
VTSPQTPPETERAEFANLVKALVMYARADARRSAMGIESDGTQERAEQSVQDAFDALARRLEGAGAEATRETSLRVQWQSRAIAAERERDLAVAHDRQPYPTAEAYEKVCAARTKWQERAEAAESALAERTRRVEALEGRIRDLAEQAERQSKLNPPALGDPIAVAGPWAWKRMAELLRFALSPAPAATPDPTTKEDAP